MVSLVLKCLLSKVRGALRRYCDLGGLGTATSSTGSKDKHVLWS